MYYRSDHTTYQQTVPQGLLFGPAPAVSVRGIHPVWGSAPAYPAPGRKTGR